MNKIATELEAKTMGGGTLSVIDNKCCTKARALELGCQIKSGFSYNDNQLVELNGIEAAVQTPNLTLVYEWEDMPISNIQQMRVRFSFVNTSSDSGPLLEFDNLTYITITPRTESGSQVFEKKLDEPLEHYLEYIASPGQNPLEVQAWLQYEVYVMLRQVSNLALYMQSDSDDWRNNVTIPLAGRWIKCNTSGKIYRFYNGSTDLSLHLYMTKQ